MAINTREKRQAIAAIALVFGPNVTPNSSKDSEWRREAANGYPFGTAGVSGSIVGRGASATIVDLTGRRATVVDLTARRTAIQ